LALRRRVKKSAIGSVIVIERYSSSSLRSASSIARS
jgi:hypothetical protein